MKSKLYVKILALCVVCSFVGIGIQPAFAVDIKQSISNSESEECKECEESESGICELLLSLWALVTIRLDLLLNLLELFENNSQIYDLLNKLFITLEIRFLFYYGLGRLNNCDWAQPPPYIS